MEKRRLNSHPSTHLIVGADGGIGSALGAQLSSLGARVLATTHRPAALSALRSYLDLADLPADWQPPPVDIAYIMAGMTSPKACREQPDLARRINVNGTLAVAERLMTAGTFVVFPSTNLVFDGVTAYQLANAPVSPQTEYGRQKAEAEERFAAIGGEFAIVRLTKVMRPDLPLFRRWIKSLAEGATIEPFSDMVFAPVAIDNVVRAITDIGATRANGIWQLSGREDVSYPEAGRHLAERLGADPALVQWESASAFGIPAGERPRHTTLDISRVENELGIKIGDVWEELDRGLGLATVEAQTS